VQIVHFSISASNIFFKFSTLRFFSQAARAEATIGALEPRVVVSDLFFLPEMTPRLFFARQWLYVKNDTELRELAGLLREKGIDRFTLVLSALPGFRQVGDRALAEFLETAPPPADRAANKPRPTLEGMR